MPHIHCKRNFPLHFFSTLLGSGSPSQRDYTQPAEPGCQWPHEPWELLSSCGSLLDLKAVLHCSQSQWCGTLRNHGKVALKLHPGFQWERLFPFWSFSLLPSSELPMRWLVASPTQWTWISASSGIWWWTGRPGVLQSMGLQRVGHDWATELSQTY